MPYQVTENGQPIANFLREQDATEFLANLQYQDHTKAYDLIKSS